YRVADLYAFLDQANTGAASNAFERPAMALGESQSGRSLASVMDVPQTRRSSGTTSISGRHDRTVPEVSLASVTSLTARHSAPRNPNQDPSEPVALRASA